MSVSTPWTNATPGSTARNNKVTVISDTGTNLTALDISKHRVVFCTADGGQFVKDHTYTANADEDAWIDITAVSSHTHTDDTMGGSIANIYAWNNDWYVLGLTKTNDLKKAQWIETVTSSGTIEDATDGTTGERSIRLRPNATSGSGSTISYPHLKANFGKPMLFSTKLRIETATSLALHTGVGADDITAADSNTRKLQAEVCTTTNNNWWLRTANGSATSQSDTGIAITTNRVRVDIEHAPDLVEAYLYIDTVALTKTTTLPTGGATLDVNLIKHSIKNSTPADRPMHMYGCRLQYYINDTWGH